MAFIPISAILLLKVLLLDYFPDFTSYYFGPKTALSGGNPYLGGDNYFTPFVYPPFVLLFFYPLSLLAPVAAGKLWTFFSVIFLLTSVYYLIKLNGCKLFSHLGLLILTLTFIFFPTKFSLGMGQINLLILLLATFFIYFYSREKQYLAGIALGISISLKIFPILIIAYLILKKKWETLFSSISTILFFILLPLAFINSDIILYFFTKILPGLITGWKGYYYNQSIGGFVARIFEEGAVHLILSQTISIVFVMLSFFAIIAKRRIRRERTNLEIGLIVALNLLVNSFSWQHHYVWLLIPLICTLFYLIRYKLNRIYYFILSISYVLTAANIKNPEVFPTIMQSHAFYGAALLLLLNIYLLLKE